MESKSRLRQIVEVFGIVAMLFAVYLAVVWVTISVAITSEGLIRWADGWHRVIEYLGILP